SLSRCLSEKTLMRLLAELGTPAQHAHVEVCPLCAARYVAITRDVDGIRKVLATTRPMATRGWVVPTWPPALGLLVAAAMITLLVSTEISLWHALHADPEDDAAQTMTTALADISTVLFSVYGEPGSLSGQQGELGTNSRYDIDEGYGTGDAS